MLCDDCGRHEAVVHITQIGPDGRVEKNLCESCAAGYSEFAGVPQQDKRHVSVDDFLRGIFNSANNVPTEENRGTNAAGELACPRCGMSYQDFSQTGNRLCCLLCHVPSAVGADFAQNSWFECASGQNSPSQRRHIGIETEHQPASAAVKGLCGTGRIRKGC